MSTNSTPLQDCINRIESAAKYIYDHLITPHPEVSGGLSHE